MATPFLTHGLIGYELQKRWHCVSACLVRESSLAVVLAVGSQQVSFSVKALAFGAICGSDWTKPVWEYNKCWGTPNKYHPSYQYHRDTSLERLDDWWLLDDYGWLLGGYWVIIGWLLDDYWMIIGWLLDDYWMIIGWLLGDYWMIIGWLLGDYWVITGWLLDDYWLITGWLLDDYWVITGWLLDDYWVITGWLLDDYWVIIGWLLDDYWLVIGWLCFIEILPGRGASWPFPARRPGGSWWCREGRRIVVAKFTAWDDADDAITGLWFHLLHI